MGSEPETTPSVLTALASLQTYSTALSTFTTAWRSYYYDTTGLDSSIASRLDGFSQLELLCSAMDGPGLRAYLTEHRDELRDPGPARALDAALLVAPDPGLLVLAAAAGFCREAPAEGKADGGAKVACRLLIGLLDRLRALGLKPSTEAREEARAVAADWKRGNGFDTQAMFKKEAIAFLLLVGVFGLVADVGGTNEVLDLVVSVSGREHAVDVFVGLGLDLDEHMPVLIQTMIKKGKQLEAVKFIQALNLAQKYPVLPVLRSYINDAKNAGNMIRIRFREDDYASQNAADAKERTLLGALQKFIKEHKLEELPILEEANKRMAQLEQQSSERKLAASAAAAAAHEVSKNIQKQQQLESQQVMTMQKVHTVTVPNQYQVASSQNILLAITHSPLVVAGSQRPVGIQNQVQTQYGGLTDYYGLASTRSYRPGSLAPGTSGPNVPSAQTSSRSKLYSADPLASVSRASDKKGSSYSYSLSNMSTYNNP